MSRKFAKMSDAELSKALGHYQAAASAWFLIGAAAAVAGVIVYFTVSDRALKAIAAAVLFFGGVCCALFGGGAAQKKLKALMSEQLGGFFRSELEKAFGPELDSPQMRIDKTLVQALDPAQGGFDECEITSFREGEYCGIHFSAANVKLNRVHECGNIHDGREIRRDTVFKGLVLRCVTSVRSHTPAIFEEAAQGRPLVLRRDGDVLTLALETDCAFSAVAPDTDLQDPDAVRRSYINSLQETERLLELLSKKEALLAEQKRKG